MSTYRGVNVIEYSENVPTNARVKLVNPETKQALAVLDFVDTAPDLITDDIIISSNPVRYYKVVDNRINTAVGLISRCLVIPVQAP